MKNLINIILFSCLLLATKLSFSQASNATNLFNSNFYLGWTTNQPLPFRFNGSTTDVITITPNGAATSADLTVTGNIITNNVLNLATTTAAYQIGGQPVLWHNGTTSNIFVGVGTGNTGSDAVLVGNQACKNCTVATKSVVIGSLAASNATAVDEDIFIGLGAGINVNNSVHNTVVGQYAGSNLTTGSGTEVFVGITAGKNTTTGNNNVFVGAASGLINTTGNQNTLIGSLSDVVSATGINNATALGYNTKVTTNNTLILGDNNVNVGIGLSGVTPGPQNKLEINASVANQSGLTFRQLTSAYTTSTTNPGNGVLAVDGNGKVIYVISNEAELTQTIATQQQQIELLKTEIAALKIEFLALCKN